jgi:hypothetical protein
MRETPIGDRAASEECGAQAARQNASRGFPARVGMRPTPALYQPSGRAGAGSVAPRAAHLLVAPAMRIALRVWMRGENG